MTGAAEPPTGDAFFDDAPCGFVAVTADGTIERANRTFATMTGRSVDDLLGQRFAGLLSIGGQIYVETHLAPMLLMSGAVRAVALELVAACGARVPVLVSATAVRDGRGRIGARVAVFDATERRAYEEELLAAKARAEESEARARTLVRSLQQALIPPVVPVIPGLQVAAAYRPAGDGNQVGGDFYDIFQLGTDDWIVAVGDVTGKGVEAAAVTALARYTIRAAAVNTGEPATILATLNDVLRQDDSTSRWCTVVIARLSGSAESGWTIEIAHGGHPLGLLLRADGTIAEVGVPGVVLGAFVDAVFVPERFALGPGDALVLYTDGVTEGRAGEEFYGETRLATTLGERRGSAHGVTYRLLDDVVAFQSGVTSDDIVIVAVRRPS